MEAYSKRISGGDVGPRENGLHEEEVSGISESSGEVENPRAEGAERRGPGVRDEHGTGKTF